MTPKPFIHTVTAFLQGWSALTRALESTLIDNLAATIPWAAPCVPAYMMFHNLVTVIGFPQWVSFLAALVVEFLGLTTVSTTFQLWSWNDSRRKIDQPAPVRIAAITAGFYLLVVILVNVILDSAPFQQRLAKALLSMLSIIGAVVLAIRSQHARRLTEIEAEKGARREERINRHLLATSGAFSPQPADLSAHVILPNVPQPAILATTEPTPPTLAHSIADARSIADAALTDYRRLSIPQRQQLPNLSIQQIQNLYPDISDRTARGWRQKARANGFQK